jgi:hemerythrin-like domain-containing protein
MTPEKWAEAITAWTKIKEQAEIDLAQANLYLDAIDKHLNKEKES